MFIVEEYGDEKLKALIGEYVKNPGDYRNIIQEVYGRDLNTLLLEFRSYCTR